MSFQIVLAAQSNSMVNEFRLEVMEKMKEPQWTKYIKDNIDVSE